MSDVMFTSSPDRLRAEARRRGLIGVATEFRRSCGQAEPRGSVRVWVWVCVPMRFALSSQVEQKLYLDLKNGERETWWQRKKGGKLPQTGGSGEKASYHRMYTTWSVWLGGHKQDNLITNYCLLSTIYLSPSVTSPGNTI